MTIGLYDVNEFKDNCGFGLIAHLEGLPSHRLLKTAIEALTCMTHRGAVGADGKTGDGCGLLLQKPDRFFRDVVAQECGVQLAREYGVGSIMLDPDEVRAARARQILNEELSDQQLTVVAWRTVPTNADCLGVIARSTMPQFAQVFVDAEGVDDTRLAAKLFVARRKAEIRLADDPHFYVSSLSAKVVSYKGLTLPVDLPTFFPDLADPRMETAICVFHQRFSTNTMPRWPLAQPFRFLAHNGEINTIIGNRNWSQARTPKFATDLIPELAEITPLVNRTGSDSSSLDNMLEVLLTGGMELHRAIRMLVPPAWQNVDHMDPDLRAFYELNSKHIEPWDGPAGLVITDGRYAVCTLDRNGLRPSRWVITKDKVITVASETGVHRYEPEDVVAKGRLGPGQILSVDTATGKLLHTRDIDNLLKAGKPYRQWLEKRALRLEDDLLDAGIAATRVPAEQLNSYMKLYQATLEERDLVMRPLVVGGQEGVGSMGDDKPMAVLSRQQRPLYDYFRQQFAQVTNPPIDPLREAIVMSLETCLGREEPIFAQTENHADRIIISSPVLSPATFETIEKLDRPGCEVVELSLHYDPARQDLRGAISDLTEAAVAAVRGGKVILVLSDVAPVPGQLPVHALLAVGAVHHRLTQEGLRCDANLVVATGTARDPHQMAALIGFGATAVYPYLAYAMVDALLEAEELTMDRATAYQNYRKGINKGLLKILSKMGIATVASYRGAQLFEAVGLDREVIDLCFPGTASRIEGASFVDLEADQRILAERAWNPRKPINPGGLLKFVHGQEYHAFNPDVVQALQKAVTTGDYQAWRECAALINGRPVATLRDLLRLRSDCTPIPLDQVEPVESILKRFDSAGMSLGALSPEAHEALAEAMNRIGGRSNSGEGGEDPARYGTLKSSKIKQVASGRFGVTPEYLVNAEVLQIKIAQGAKPGEGGQLPGFKVNELIARLRYSVPGITLISPPPHHDIYSIEDLAQLIFDLKQINPEALVSVKLVARPGVGTIAAGVAKAYADLITISGYDGGTAASPLTSIHHAGSPWELGLSEAHQTLCANDLRHKVLIQTDGGLKTGLDVVKAAMLGAESFAFGTTPMVALGCKYLRICHLNNCATGVATQNEALRHDHYRGTVQMVMNFFRFVAEETREIMASLGIARLEDLVGRADLLEPLPGDTEKQHKLDLGPIIYRDELLRSKPQTCQQPGNTPFDKAELAERMVADILPAIEQKTGGTFRYSVTNCDRSIGARLSGEIARRHGNLGMSDRPIRLELSGVAGQSLGVWNAGGLDIYLEGDANDYVGKGMAGGNIVIRSPAGSTFVARHTTILGNSCLYGATGGALFAAGQAGERFAVRNSGVTAVVEGAGDHCCEYMTAGTVVVLGPVGENFGAGMTGGFALVLDEDQSFHQRLNPTQVNMQRIDTAAMADWQDYLRRAIARHVEATDSAWGRELLEDFAFWIGKFWLVKPKSAKAEQLLPTSRRSVNAMLIS